MSVFRERLKDKNKDMQISDLAISISKDIESLGIVDALLNSAQDEDAAVRTCAVWALGDAGEASLPLIRFLFSTLKDENSEVQCAAVGALSNLWIDTDQIVSALHEAQAENNRSGREDSGTG